MNNAASKSPFEYEPCPRCMGSGEHKYCELHGTVCFQCGGRREVLTKRGRAAMAHLRTLREKPVSEVAAGDHVWWCDKWIVVSAVDDSSMTIGGQKMPKANLTKVQVLRGADDSKATLAAALAYQATLGKNGKPAKR